MFMVWNRIGHDSPPMILPRKDRRGKGAQLDFDFQMGVSSSCGTAWPSMEQTSVKVCLQMIWIRKSKSPERRFLTAVVRPWSWHMYCLFPSNIRLRRDGDKEIAAPFVAHPGIWNWGSNKFHYWFLLRSDGDSESCKLEVVTDSCPPFVG